MKNWLGNIKRVDVMPRPGGTDLRYSEWTQSLPPALFKKFIKTLTWEDFALYPDTNLLKVKLALRLLHEYKDKQVHYLESYP